MNKGSNRRPMQVPPDEFGQRWAETFGGPSSRDAPSSWARRGEETHGPSRDRLLGSPPSARDSYGQDLGPSPLVACGRIIQIGPRPGALDAHVRPGYLLLRCEAGAGYNNDRPFEMSFNAEDAAILRRVAGITLDLPCRADE